MVGLTAVTCVFSFLAAFAAQSVKCAGSALLVGVSKRGLRLSGAPIIQHCRDFFSQRMSLDKK
jgi:hypothetical protein